MIRPHSHKCPDCFRVDQCDIFECDSPYSVLCHLCRDMYEGEYDE